MHSLLTIKNFINKLNQSKLLALMYIGILFALFFAPYTFYVLYDSQTPTDYISFYSSFSYHILLFCNTQLYLQQLMQTGIYDKPSAMELITHAQTSEYALFIMEFLFLILLIIAILYLLISFKKLKRYNTIVFIFSSLLCLSLFIYFVTYANNIYNGLELVVFTYYYSTAFYLSISFLVIIILLSLAYLILSLYFKKHPEATLLDKNKTIKPRKPTNKERIAELEQQVQDLQDKLNNQE